MTSQPEADTTSPDGSVAEPPNAWIIVAAGFLLVLVLYGTYYSFGVFKNPILNDLGWSDSVYSGAHAMYLIIHGIFAVILGRLCDKIGPSRVVGFGTVLIALGYLLTSQVNDAWEFYLYLGLLIGIGMGAAYVPPLATVARWFDARRGLALGVTAAGVGVGQIVLPPLLKYLIAEVGWRDSLMIMAGITCALGIPAAMLLRNPLHRTNAAVEMSAGDATRTSSFWLLLIVFACLVFGSNIVFQHLEAHVEDSGISELRAALVITLIGAGGIFGRIISGGVADRFGNRIVAGTCLALQILVFCVLFRAEGLWVFYVMGALYGLGYGGTLPLIIKMSSEFFGTSSGGTIFGLLLAGAAVGGASGVFLTGVIHDATGDYIWAFFMAGVIVIIASLINLILKPPRTPATTEETPIPASSVRSRH